MMSKHVERSQTGVLWQRWQLGWGLFFMALHPAGEYVEHAEGKLLKQAGPVRRYAGQTKSNLTRFSNFQELHIVETLFSQLWILFRQVRVTDFGHHASLMHHAAHVQAMQADLVWTEGRYLLMLCLRYPLQLLPLRPDCKRGRPTSNMQKYAKVFVQVYSDCLKLEKYCQHLPALVSSVHTNCVEWRHFHSGM